MRGECDLVSRSRTVSQLVSQYVSQYQVHCFQGRVPVSQYVLAHKIGRRNEVCASLRGHGVCVSIFYRKRGHTVDTLGHWDTDAQLLRFHGNTVSQPFALPSNPTGTLGHRT